jgi:hypothetical protein
MGRIGKEPERQFASKVWQPGSTEKKYWLQFVRSIVAGSVFTEGNFSSGLSISNMILGKR